MALLARCGYNLHDLLELVEARTKHGATIFCTQYETDDRYVRLNPTPGEDSPVTNAIMDRIVHNVYLILLEGANPCATVMDWLPRGRTVRGHDRQESLSPLENEAVSPLGSRCHAG